MPSIKPTVANLLTCLRSPRSTACDRTFHPGGICGASALRGSDRDLLLPFPVKIVHHPMRV